MKVMKTLIFLVMFLLLGCQSPITGVVGFEPSGIPVKITVDTNGKVGFELQKEVKYPTQLGIFSAGIIADPVSYFNKTSTLTIRIDCQDTFYDLHGNDFSLDFQSSYYEKINITKRGNDLFLELRRIDSDSLSCISLIEDTDSANNSSSSRQSTSHSGDYYAATSCAPDQVMRKKAPPYIFMGDSERRLYTSDLRLTPGYLNKDDTTDVLYKLPCQEYIDKVLGGPAYVDGLTWWRVNWRGHIGWLSDTFPNGEDAMVFFER